jgi:glycosyltransferase involved in cell wall biosynthesis/ubiquinone/menaquinone biosynthesis C-methylase UbiE
VKVLHVVHYPVFGGPHNQAAQLHAPLAARGWEITAIVPDEPGNAAARLRAAGVPTIAMPLARLRATPRPDRQARYLLALWRDVRALRRLIGERGAGLVVVTGLVNPQAAIAARLEGVPVVWQLLDTRAPALLRWLFTPLVRALADVVMTTGQEVARVHPGVLTLGRRRVPFFPPVDLEQFRPDRVARERARAELGVEPGQVLVGAVGNLNPQKGHEYFVRAAARVAAVRPDAVFRVLGAPTPTQEAYRSALVAEVAGRGLGAAGTFAFVDPGSRVPELLPAFDVFVLSSVPRSEGVPTVILEAMACGIPVVAADVGGVAEVVERGVTGHVVPPLEPDAIATAVLDILGDAGHAARLATAALARAEERYGLDQSAADHVTAFERARLHRAVARASNFEGTAPCADVSFDEAMSALADRVRPQLACPACHGDLAWAEGESRCRSCEARYPVDDGIPVFTQPGTHGHDELDHAAEHARRQARYFDAVEAADYEVERPRGTDRFHRFLVARKLRRSLDALADLPRGATAVTVCGGSGMDAEFLARAGFDVIASDVSIGAARRARERSQRAGVPFLSVVADVERLPFATASVDLVYVHDGLHHLIDPSAGIREMARVARSAVSVTEPARAAATRLAVSLGLALSREESGNVVERLTAAGVDRVLRESGFAVVRSRRYAMYYRHRPGRVSTVLGSAAVFPLSAVAWLAADRVLGRFGNKLAVQAERPHPGGRS